MLREGGICADTPAVVLSIVGTCITHSRQGISTNPIKGIGDDFLSRREYRDKSGDTIVPKH